MLNWALLAEELREKGSIRELHLYKVPELKTCNNWGLVKELGRIEFKGKYSVYRGGLVEYGGKVFYVPESRIQALARFRKWNFKKDIRVIPEKEAKLYRRKG